MFILDDGMAEKAIKLLMCLQVFIILCFNSVFLKNLDILFSIVYIVVMLVLRITINELIVCFREIELEFFKFIYELVTFQHGKIQKQIVVSCHSLCF